jgi:hypothetical protein
VQNQTVRETGVQAQNKNGTFENKSDIIVGANFLDAKERRTWGADGAELPKVEMKLES